MENLKIEDFKKRDQVMIDGKWYELIHTYQYGDALCVKIKISYYQSDTKRLVDVLDRVQDHKPFIHSMTYHGSKVDIEACVLVDRTLVYLEIAGQEGNVRSITSVLMQGHIAMNGHAIDSDIGVFKINKAGNKRKMTSLEDEMAHAILYHAPSISDVGFNILIG